MIEERIGEAIRDVKDFPKEGIVFKDITPIFLNPQLCTDIVNAFVERLAHLDISVITAIESRGFLFALSLAQKMDIPFVPVRKKGKLPGETIERTYDLEYGSATIEMHKADLKEGSKVLIHDDLLATGGTAVAVAELLKEEGSEVAAFSFLVSLDFLGGKDHLRPFSENIITLANY